MGIDRTHCTSKTGRFTDRETETQDFTIMICTLYWQPQIHVRRLARTADWTGAAVRRDRPVARLQRAVIMPCFSRADCDTPE